MKSPRVKIACAFALGFFASIPAAGAADITWGTATTIAGDTDVSTVGSPFSAFNIGNTGVASVTVNGVFFAPFPIANGSTGASNAALSVAGFGGSQPVATALPLGSASAPFISLSAGYRTLLSTGAVEAPFVQILDVNLTGLTIGSSYIVQLWINDSSLSAGSPVAAREVSDFNGHFAAVDTNVGNIVGGVGTHITGSFVADASTEFLSVHGGIAAAGSDGAVLNAIQVRVVPEPATLGLSAAALLLLLSRRPFRSTPGHRRLDH